MICPRCGAYADGSFCQNCGMLLRKPDRNKNRINNKETGPQLYDASPVYYNDDPGCEADHREAGPQLFDTGFDSRRGPAYGNAGGYEAGLQLYDEGAEYYDGPQNFAGPQYYDNAQDYEAGPQLYDDEAQYYEGAPYYDEPQYYEAGPQYYGNAPQYYDDAPQYYEDMPADYDEEWYDSWQQAGDRQKQRAERGRSRRRTAKRKAPTGLIFLCQLLMGGILVWSTITIWNGSVQNKAAGLAAADQGAATILYWVIAGILLLLELYFLVRIGKKKWIRVEGRIYKMDGCHGTFGFLVLIALAMASSAFALRLPAEPVWLAGCKNMMLVLASMKMVLYLGGAAGIALCILRRSCRTQLGSGLYDSDF